MKTLYKTLLLLFAVHCSLFTICCAQAIVQWKKSLGGTGEDDAHSIQQTADGGYVVAGASGSNDGDVTGNLGGWDYWLVKFDNAGNIEWQKSLGGSSGEGSYSIKQTTDGGYVVAGQSYSNDGDVTGYHGGGDYWIVKLDSAGNVQWQKSLGGTDIDWALSVQQTADGGYVVAGKSYSNDGDVTGNHGLNDYWVVKLDSAGNIQWQKSLGGPGDDIATSIQQTADGGYVVAGSSEANGGDVTGHHAGPEDYWVVKLDSAGNIQWQKSLGGTDEDIARSVQQTADGGYVVAGWAYSSNGDVTGNHGYADYWIVKLDSAGNIQWQKCLGGGGYEYGYSIQQTTDGGYVVAGEAGSNNGDVTGNHGSYDYWVVKLDSADNIQWQKSLGGTLEDIAYSIQEIAQWSYVVAGRSKSNNGDVTGNHGGWDYWVVKFLGYVCSSDFTLIADTIIPHHYWLIPEINGIPPFTYLWNWGDGATDSIAYPSHIYDTAGYYNICLHTVDSAGCIDSICVGYELQKSQHMNTIITVDVVDSIPSVPTNIQNTDVLQSWLVFPNPAAGNSFINYTLSTPATVSIDLYDVLGNKLQQLVKGDQEQGEHSATIDARKLANGVYVLQIRAGDQMASQKVILLR